MHIYGKIINKLKFSDKNALIVRENLIKKQHKDILIFVKQKLYYNLNKFYFLFII